MLPRTTSSSADTGQAQSDDSERKGRGMSWSSTKFLRSSKRMSKVEYNTLVNTQYVNSMGFQVRLGNKIPTGVELLGLHELTKINFYRQLMTEFFGIFVLLTVGCNCITNYANNADGDLSMASILLGWGFTVASLVWTISHVSGCILNPAIAISLFLNRRIPLIRTLAFIAVEVPGAWLGATYHDYLRGEEETTCTTRPNAIKGVTVNKAFSIEFFISFFLVFFVFATIDHKRQDHGGSHAFMVGGVVIMLVNFAAEMTGASMNPARSLGPAIVHNIWTHHWIYWVAPISGATIGGFFYDTLFSERVIAWHRYLHVGPLDHYEESIIEGKRASMPLV